MYLDYLVAYRAETDAEIFHGEMLISLHQKRPNKLEVRKMFEETPPLISSNPERRIRFTLENIREVYADTEEVGYFGDHGELKRLKFSRELKNRA